MKKTASRWHRLLQLVGLVLIAVLSAEAGRAQEEEIDEEPDTVCVSFGNDDCKICHTDGEDCMVRFCPVGDPRGIEISCEGDEDDDENG